MILVGWFSVDRRCTTMVREGLRAPEINANLKKRMRKQGPKKVCGIKRKQNQNGAQIGARNCQHFEKYRKRHANTHWTLDNT